MANGSFQDLTIVAYDSGMRRVLVYNVYSKDTKIRVYIAWQIPGNTFADSQLVNSIDLSPAGNVLATGSDDWQARICLCLLICRIILDVLIVF